ncbi:hypothetical protein AVEN_106419-1 [Araneus ventricosus]|uniref:Uncharacterized protein n=1 Tax=Araneus ventricosus TaxID=182803 RepID=A0A4Y2AT49_ARAVE|nr:hypothetical protein AVEN_106419-1 [Araneus ventricosus]
MESSASTFLSAEQTRGFLYLPEAEENNLFIIFAPPGVEEEKKYPRCFLLLEKEKDLPPTGRTPGVGSGGCVRVIRPSVKVILCSLILFFKGELNQCIKEEDNVKTRGELLQKETQDTRVPIRTV